MANLTGMDQSKLLLEKVKLLNDSVSWTLKCASTRLWNNLVHGWHPRFPLGHLERLMTNVTGMKEKSYWFWINAQHTV